MSAIGRLAAAICAIPLLATPANALEEWEKDWTVVMVARDGSWGVATRHLMPRAIAAALRDCQAMSAEQSDCGAQFTTVRAGWTVAALCGDEAIIVAEKTLAEAESAAAYREIDLQLNYVLDLPPCRRVLTVDPTGAIVDPKTQYYVDPYGWLAGR